jgi:hypothetical protein
MDTTTNRTILQVTPNGEIEAYNETITRTPIPAVKFTKTNPACIKGVFEPYEPYTSQFNLVTLGNEWALVANIIKLPVTKAMIPIMIGKDTFLADASRANSIRGAKIITETSDGSPVVGKAVTVNYKFDGQVVLILANNCPYLLWAKGGEEFVPFAFSNIHNNGRVCADQFTKYLLHEVAERPATDGPLAKINRSSPVFVQSKVIIDLFFTSRANNDLAPAAEHTMVKFSPDDKKIPDTLLKLSNLQRPSTPDLQVGIFGAIMSQIKKGNL